jgi:tetratricopeptide (TPR) repeat protein
MGYAALWAHDYDRAIAESQAAIEIAGRVDAKAVAASGHFTLGIANATSGRLDEGLDELDYVLTISGSVGDVFHQSFALNLVGFTKNWTGDYAEALHPQREALRIAREHKLLFPLLQGLFIHGVTLTGFGDYDNALATMKEGLALAAKLGEEINCHRLLNSLGWLHIECGDLETALDLNRQGAEGARKRGDPETIANAEINLGDIFLARGDLVLAHEFLESVHRLAKDPSTSEWMKWRYSTHLFASLGELWLARGDYAKATEFCDHCLDIATRTQSRKNLVKGWRLKGEIALAQRQWDEAGSALGQALTIAQAIGNPTQLWKTHLALGRFYTGNKKPESAERAFHAGREVIDRIKDRLQSATLRASLESAPMIRQVYDLSA